MLLGALLVGIFAFIPLSGVSAQESVHGIVIPTDPSGEDQMEAALHTKSQPAATSGTTRSATPRATAPIIDDDFIIFGYIQSEGMLQGVRWHALTDVGSLFITFDSNGDITNPSSWTGRSTELRSGGAAERAGVGVHMVLLNSGFNNSVTEAAMDNGDGSRTNLVSQIAALVANPGTDANTYVQGVSLDLEPFSWTATTSTNLASFFQELRTALDGVDPNLEISWYVDPTPATTQFSNLGTYVGSIDYILYSMYDFGTGTTPRAVSDFDSSLPQQTEYLVDYGVPPEKLVPVISTYSRQFFNTTSYGVAGSSSSSTGQGFGDAIFATTDRPTPFTRNYVTGDETSWYTDGTDTFVNPLTEGLEFKIRQALSYQDDTSAFTGRRLGGVGFWSLFWLSEFTSFDYVAGTTGNFVRTYTQTYEICQTALSPSGTQRFLIESFETDFNARWEDPNTPDEVGDTDNDSFRIFETAPGGAGAPDTVRAVRVAVDFEQATGNVAHFRHEPLADNTFTSAFDSNAMAGFVDATTEFFAFVHSGTSASPTAYPNTSVAMLLLDADGELERSPLFPLSTAGWQEISWDITDNANIFGVVTAETPFNNGDGVLDSAGGGARDIAFVGFRIQDEAGLSGAKSIYFDEIGYEHQNPGGLDYVINEFRYDGTTSEFVEIYGPAGSIPAGMQLRTFDPSNGSVLNSYSLTGSVPDDGGGFGFFVVGDTGVANVDFNNSGAGIDLSDLDPGAIQLYNTNTGGVYDSVVYEAFGGLDDLIRQQTLGVVDEGRPWLGRAASGSNGAGTLYSFGRYPDGTDTDVNFDDFGAQLASSGTANGGAITALPINFSFSTAPNELYQTFQSATVVDPTSAGLPASPGGGTAYRCIDTTGGGVIGFVGDAALGSGGSGYNVEGQIYIPSGAEPAQAIAIGFCARHGSTFFSGTTANAAYEDGYWLIYENVAGVGLNDGRADHAGTFEFVQASHDNQDGNPVDFLGSATTGTLGVTPGTWTTFRLTIDPSGASGQQLLAKINDLDVFRGDIPAGGPISGAVAVGFRENHAGAPVSSEGTWIDNLVINTDNNVAGIPVPVELSALGIE